MHQSIAGRVLAAWLCCLAHAQSANAQAAETKLEFEVASIKPSALRGAAVIRLGRQGGPGSGDPGRVTYTFSTIRDLILDAYGVKRNQLSGGPNWLDSERFDIVAKVAAGATKEQVKIMLQNLLVERFKLTLHHEIKELPVYALVVGAKGLKLKDSTAAHTPPEYDSLPKERGLSQADPPPLPPRPGIRGMKIGPDGCPQTLPMATGRGGNFTLMTPNGECMISSGHTMEDLANELSSRFDRPVIDQTGLEGTYDLRLRYDPSSLPRGRGGPMSKDIRDDSGPAAAGSDPASLISPDGDPPGIFTALQEQAGLRLESKKTPVDFLLIDHVEKSPAKH
jgi:uncharacterized protein (TIGR03435 family)